MEAEPAEGLHGLLMKEVLNFTIWRLAYKETTWVAPISRILDVNLTDARTLEMNIFITTWVSRKSKRG